MGLKQDIIVVNEFTAPLPDGSGSLGSTPGRYIERYMARELATEPITPIRRYRTDRFIERYMAREEAVERITVPDVKELKSQMFDGQREGGVAFGYGEVSLSDDQLHASSNDIQRLFDEGHTVMKTVLSFSEEYLHRQGLIPDDFSCKRPGDYRGHLDQLKLRAAVMHGLHRMSRSAYDDLRYVGVIQVDTEHVHCHLALVDAGKGTVMRDGTQKGKLTASSISLLRRGTDAWLDDKQKVKHLSSAVGYERRNVTSYVKKWAHQQMLRESLPQFLIACLPEDRSLWRMSTNRKEMAKPNRVVRELVEEVLEQPGSPLGRAMSNVREYANHRRKSEDLSVDEWQRLVDTGYEQIIERGANAVYSALRQLPDDVLTVRRPMLDVMSMDYEELAQRTHSDDEHDEIIDFGFRLRSYSHRLNDHNKQRKVAHDRVRQWETADEAGVAGAGSEVLLRFWRLEEEYQARCAAKYRSFLQFAPETSPWYDKWESISDYGERMLSLESMRKDSSLRRMKDPDEAEARGMEIYGQRGGHLVSLGDDVSLQRLDERVRKMRIERGRKIMDLRSEMAKDGLRMDVIADDDGRLTPEITVGPEYPFDEVKGLDMHRMRFDFSRDVEVGEPTRAEFDSWARRRNESLREVLTYLSSTGQEESVDEFPVDDVQMMMKTSAELAEGASSGQAVLASRIAELARSQSARRSSTYQLSEPISREVSDSVYQAVREPVVMENDHRDTPVS